MRYIIKYKIDGYGCAGLRGMLETAEATSGTVEWRMGEEDPDVVFYTDQAPEAYKALVGAPPQDGRKHIVIIDPDWCVEIGGSLWKVPLPSVVGRVTRARDTEILDIHHDTPNTWNLHYAGECTAMLDLAQLKELRDSRRINLPNKVIGFNNAGYLEITISFGSGQASQRSVFPQYHIYRILVDNIINRGPTN